MTDAPPTLVTDRAHKVWTWYVVYCVAMVCMYAGVALLGVVFLASDPKDLDMAAAEAEMLGAIFIAAGGVLAVPFAVAPFLPRAGWAWVYGIVMISIGMTSACCWPATIPLLIFWIKPETKAL